MYVPDHPNAAITYTYDINDSETKQEDEVSSEGVRRTLDVSHQSRDGSALHRGSPRRHDAFSGPRSGTHGADDCNSDCRIALDGVPICGTPRAKQPLFGTRVDATSARPACPVQGPRLARCVVGPGSEGEGGTQGTSSEESALGTPPRRTYLNGTLPSCYLRTCQWNGTVRARQRNSAMLRHEFGLP